MRRLAIAMLVVLLVGSSAAAQTKPRISLEVLTRTGVPLNAAQQWNKILSDLNLANVQIRSGSNRDEAKIDQIGTAARPSYRVVGVLMADNVLYLPNAKFKISDTKQLRKWFD